jgi:phenylalanyl-tRNA synthetase beta chain
MRVPLSWLLEFAALGPAGAGSAAAGRSDAVAAEMARRLTAAGLEVESVERVGYDISGVVVAQVRQIEELPGYRKPIRYCRVSAGSGTEQHVICGAVNFSVGDLVPLALPGSTLPGGVQIGARQAYGRTSEGMISSAAELAIGDDHSGILVLPADAPVGADFADYAGLRDHVLDIAPTPDKGYALSVRGVARELAIAYGSDFTDPADLGLPGDVETVSADVYPASIEDASACDRFVLREVRGIDGDRPTPLLIRVRLARAGMRSVSLAVDVTNYLMLELGQPLHAFDRSRLTGPIVVRRARPGEQLETLDHVVRELDPDDILITDSSGPISLAGTMGGLATEISADSSDLVIEAAHFSARGTARMSRRHKLSTEASARFERGVDRELPLRASARAASLLAALGGGRAVPGCTHASADVTRVPVVMAVDYPDQVAGVVYGLAAVSRRLRQVGCELTVDGHAATGWAGAFGPAAGGGSAGPGGAGSAGTGATGAGAAGAGAGGAGLAGADGAAGPAAAAGAGQPAAPAALPSRHIRNDHGKHDRSGQRLTVMPPSWRPDLTDPSDLAEEVIRLEGYENIPVRMPRAPAGHGRTPRQRMRQTIGRALAATGYVEVISNPFAAPADADRLQLPPYDPRRSVPRLVNPIKDDEPLMRGTLLPGLLRVLGRNIGRGFADVALFELGLVFLTRPEGQRIAPILRVDRGPSVQDVATLHAALPDQPLHLAVALTGYRQLPGWWGSGRAASWEDAVEAARQVLRISRVPFSVRAAQYAPWHPGRCAALHVQAGEGQEWNAGHAGELHPRVVQEFGLPPRTCAMELDMSVIETAAAALGPVQAQVTSAYPVATQDVALIVPASVPAADVEAALVAGVTTAAGAIGAGTGGTDEPAAGAGAAGAAGAGGGAAGAGVFLESIRLFDVYTGEQVGEGRKSLAYTLRFRAPDRTLTAEEVSAARDAAVAEAARRTGAVLRGCS